MPKFICFLYTETNGLHQTKEDVAKKSLYAFARLVAINYIIGYREDKKFIEVKKVRKILNPDCINFSDDAVKFHGITRAKAIKKGENNVDIMTTLKNDLKNVHVIVSHNLPFHIKTLQVECFRTCTYINFNDFILIDTISFVHKLEYPRLKILSKSVLNKKFSKKSAKFNLVIIKKIFLKLYDEYEKEVEDENKHMFDC